MGNAMRMTAAAILAGAVLTQSPAPLSAADPWMWRSHASAYGRESIWDGGRWSRSEQRWIGYIGSRTSWGWHCAEAEHLDPASPYYAWAVLTPESLGVASRDPRLLGTWIEMRIPQPDGALSAPLLLPVTDAGPWGVWWTWDVQEPVVQALGWDAVGPSRYEERSGPYYGRRDVLVRYRPDLPRYCPRRGYGLPVEIRTLLEKGTPQRAVAAMFGVFQQHVSDLGRRTRWKHVAQP